MSEKLILIAEDDPVVLQMLEAALANFDCEVRAVKDGAQALALLKQIQPAVMILDLELPHISGETIISEIQISPRLQKMALIVTTASPASYIRQFERYATLVVQKPYQLTLIMDTIEQALKGDELDEVR